MVFCNIKICDKGTFSTAGTILFNEGQLDLCDLIADTSPVITCSSSDIIIISGGRNYTNLEKTEKTLIFVMRAKQSITLETLFNN